MLSLLAYQDWVAADFQGEADAGKWQYTLSESDVAELQAALAGLRASGKAIEVRDWPGIAKE